MIRLKKKDMCNPQKCLFRVCSLWPTTAIFFGVVATTCMHANV